MADQKPANTSALTPIAAALEQVLASVPRIADVELVPLQQACGRVLAEDCIAAIDVPPHANSAMDGYAVRAADVMTTPVELPVTQRIAAGEVGSPLAPGQAARIFTGAPLPDGADAVVMQENCDVSDDGIRILQSVQPGENLRARGEDVAAGAMLLSAGHRLRPQDIGLLASVGLTEVSLVRRLRVAIMTTGDELVLPGQTLGPGQIYNANAFTLRALLEGLAVEVMDLGIVPDSASATAAALKQATAADCIITTGGVSVGEEDHVKAAVEAAGHLDLWKLAIKPGKPFASGKVHDTRFFGLPGNPVSAFVTFVLLVRPALLAMQGCKQCAVLQFPVQAGFSSAQSGERQEYLRVSLTGQAGAELSVIPYSNQSSGVGASLSGADGLAIIPPYTAVNAGDRLAFIPFSELLG